jgi:5'-nucleotidase / UDP-sugar diphosphatase
VSIGRGSTVLILIAIVLVASKLHATTRHLKIIHWNDLHSQIEPLKIGSATVGGFLNLTRVVDSLRAVVKEYGDACLVLDGGDEFQGTLVSTITKGKSAYELLNLIKPDAVAIGNHEFDYGWPNLRYLLRTTAHFPIVNANITTEAGMPIAKQYLIKSVGGLRVGIIGLTLESLASSTLPENTNGLTIRRYDEVLPKLLKEVHAQSVDLVILLTHIGVEADSLLAAKYPRIGIIVGGHSHTPLFEPIRVGHTLIVQAGSKGRWVGEADLDIDSETDSVLKSHAHLIDVRPSAKKNDARAARVVKKLLALVDSSYDTVIGTLGRDWRAGGDYNGNLATFEALALQNHFRVDLGCMNHGGLRKSLAAGPIRLKDVYEINPFQNELVKITLDGFQLQSALEHMLRDATSETCEFAGLRCTFDQELGKLTSIQIGEKALTDNSVYTMVTNVFVASKLRSIFGLRTDAVSVEHLGVVDADAIAAEIRKQQTIDGKPVEWVYFRN